MSEQKQELTEEEKKADADWREAQRHHRVMVRSSLAEALKAVAHQSLGALEVTTSTTYSFASPALCQAVAAWLSAGAPPADPLDRPDRTQIVMLDTMAELLHDLGPIIARAVVREKPAEAAAAGTPSPQDPAATGKP